MTRSTFFILIAFLLLTVSSLGQYDFINGRFTNYDALNGMSCRNINNIQVDKHGLVWIATEEGLNRFDGSKFKHYLKDGSQGCIPDNYIKSTLPSQFHEILWVATDTEGLCRYSYETDSFVSEQTFISQDSSIYGNCEAIIELNEDWLVLAFGTKRKTEGGLVKYNHVTGEFIELIGSEKKVNLEEAYIDPLDSNTIWCCGDSLYKFDLSQRTYKTFDFHLRNYRWNNYYQSIIRHDDSKLYVSAWSDGILIFDTNEDKFVDNVIYDNQNIHRSQNNAVRKLVRKSEEEYWIVTADKGSGIYNFKQGTFSFYQNDETDPYSIWRISGRDVVQDDQGIVWFGMASGLSILNPYIDRFDYIPLEAAEPTDDRQFTCNQAVQIGDKIVLAAGFSKCYYILDKETKKVESTIGTFDTELSGPAYVSGTIIAKDSEDRIYTQCRDRAWKLNVEKSEFELLLDFKTDFALTGSASNVNVVYCDSKDRVWAGSDDNFVASYDPSNETYESYWLIGDTVQPSNQSGKNLVLEITEDNQGNIWFSCVNGVFRINNKGEVNTIMDLVPSFNATEYGMSSIEWIGEQLIICTWDEGIFAINPLNGQVDHFGREEGLPVLRIAETIVDNNDVLWCITSNGLFSLNFETGEVNPYSVSDGLKYYDLVSNEISVLDDGEIIIGMHRGLTAFYPNELPKQPVPFSVILQDVEIDGVTLESDSSFLFQNKLNINEPFQRIELSYQALGYVQPETYRYRVRLEGHEENWFETNENSISYSGLKGGDYTFQVMAGSVNGEWNDNLKELQISIPVPFYNRGWFYMILAVLIGLISWGLYQYRVNAIRKEEKLKHQYDKKLAEVEMTALRSQMNPHFLFNSLNSIKYYIIENQTDEASDYLTKFSRLIRLILQNSKSQMVPLESDLEALSLYIELESLRFDENFDYSIKMDDNVQAEFIEVPPLIIQPFVENAIWHGLLHKTGNGKLEVRLKVVNGSLVCEIEDDGIGRKKALEFKSKSAIKNKSMGMDITRNRLLKMPSDLSNEASINVTDKVSNDGEPEGTLVTVKIPI